jgi:hypothetical protein
MNMKPIAITALLASALVGCGGKAKPAVTTQAPEGRCGHPWRDRRRRSRGSCQTQRDGATRQSVRGEEAVTS